MGKLLNMIADAGSKFDDYTNFIGLGLSINRKRFF